MSRKQQSITLSINQSDKVTLLEIAYDLGMLWGDKPNISRLVEAIAHNELVVAANHDWQESRIQALLQAANMLFDQGHVDPASEITHLLLQRSELSEALRARLHKRFSQPLPDWREAIDLAIQRRKPFRLLYQDAAERHWAFTVRHATIRFYEKRWYLEIWCEETEGNQDLPELAHNRTLRLDRLQEVEVAPIPGKWHIDLDRVEVEFHVLGGLATAYQPRSSDKGGGWLPDRRGKVYRRNISQTFWLLREFLPYGPDCLIVKPDAVREKMIAQLQKTLAGYTS
jgi:predicted DNA-binding transcriptional regulator YafY